MAKFAGSYSKLKNFETCPKRYYEIDVAKNPAYQEKIVPGGPLDWGNKAHLALAHACSGASPLPEEFEDFQKWVDAVRSGPGDLFVEQKYAITRDFRKTEWFAHNVWWRSIGDVVRVSGRVALALDWKTGKVLHDSVQLAILAQCIFSHFPDVREILTKFIWLKDDCETVDRFTRKDISDMWIGMLDRINALEYAHKTQTFPPKPSGLCVRYCTVTSCPFHKKGTRG